MPLRRFVQDKPFLTFTLVVAGWILVPVAVKSMLRASFFEFQAPINVAASYIRDLQTYWSLRSHSKDDLIAAGRDLARVNASYDLAVRENAELHAQIDHMEHMLDLPPLPEYNYIHARVVRREFSSWWQRLIIRQGRDAHIPLGAPVVFSGGVVGRVTRVHAYTAEVTLISSPKVRLAAVVEGDERPISFQGGINPVFGPAKGIVEYVPIDIFASATARRRLVTSGLGGVFPAGLNLGEITKLEPSTDGLFQTGVVALDPRLSQLSEVTVLVPVVHP